NPTDFFNQAINSILNQSYPLNQIVLVNDGGREDHTLEMIPDDPRIEYYKKENGGVASARNFAISKASSDFIAFLDQDDFWYEDKIETQIKCIDQQRPKQMVISKIDVLDSENALIKSRQEKINRTFENLMRSNDKINQLIDSNFIYSSGPLIHRSIFEDIGVFDSRFDPHDDWDMYLRIALSGYPIHVVGRSLSIWRFHGKNESQNRIKMARTRQRVLEDKIQRFKSTDYHSMIQIALGKSKLIRINELLYLNKRYRQYRQFFCKWFRDNGRFPSVKSIKRFFTSFFI
ncbi:MAG: glycosyltransferase, partial [Calditrichaeota bacterium]|nr:glycosyltransferase [Calditrichota bacterium]